MATKTGQKVKKVGNTNYGQNVLTSIIELATKEVDGVCSMQGRGVRMQISGKKLKIDVFVKVFVNVQCSEVSFRVQENIKQNIESATDYKVDEVNVNVLSVASSKQNNSEHDDDK